MDLAKNSRLENLPALVTRDGMERIAISTRDVRRPTLYRTRALVEVFASQKNVSVRTDTRANCVRRRLVLEVMVRRRVRGTVPAISKRVLALARNFSVTTIAAKRFDVRRHSVFMEFVWASRSVCATRDFWEMDANCVNVPRMMRSWCVAVTDPVTRRREFAIAYEDMVILLAARNVRTMDVEATEESVSRTRCQTQRLVSANKDLKARDARSSENARTRVTTTACVPEEFVHAFQDSRVLHVPRSTDVRTNVVRTRGMVCVIMENVYVLPEETVRAANGSSRKTKATVVVFVIWTVWVEVFALDLDVHVRLDTLVIIAKRSCLHSRIFFRIVRINVFTANVISDAAAATRDFEVRNVTSKLRANVPMHALVKVSAYRMSACVTVDSREMLVPNRSRWTVTDTACPHWANVSVSDLGRV